MGNILVMMMMLVIVDGLFMILKKKCEHTHIVITIIVVIDVSINWNCSIKQCVHCETCQPYTVFSMKSFIFFFSLKLRDIQNSVHVCVYTQIRIPTHQTSNNVHSTKLCAVLRCALRSTAIIVVVCVSHFQSVSIIIFFFFVLSILSYACNKLLLFCSSSSSFPFCLVLPVHVFVLLLCPYFKPNGKSSIH